MKEVALYSRDSIGLFCKSTHLISMNSALCVSWLFLYEHSYFVCFCCCCCSVQFFFFFSFSFFFFFWCWEEGGSSFPTGLICKSNKLFLKRYFLTSVGVCLCLCLVYASCICVLCMCLVFVSCVCVLIMPCVFWLCLCLVQVAKLKTFTSLWDQNHLLETTVPSLALQYRGNHVALGSNVIGKLFYTLANRPQSVLFGQEIDFSVRFKYFW